MSAYTVSNAIPMAALPTTIGVVQKFVANATNAGPSTFAPDGLAAAPIFGLGAGQLQGNEIVAEGIVTLESYVGPLLNSGALCWVLIDCDGGAQQVGAGMGNQQASTVGQVQTGTLITAEAGGSANAITATIASTLTALSDGQPFTVVSSASNTGATTLAITLGSNALSAMPVVKGNNQPLAFGDIPAAGYPIQLNFSAQFNAYVMQNPSKGISIPVSVVGTQRNLRAAVTVAAKTITYTADQIVVAPAFNGTASLLANFNQNFDGTKVGLGGMDAGLLPASDYVAFYAAVTESGAAGIFGTNASSLVGEIYGGAHLPSGVVATALIGIWPTNADGQLKVASQKGRSVTFPTVTAFQTNNVTGSSPTSVSITVVPVNAVSCRGWMQEISTTTSSMTFNVGVDATAGGMMGQQSAAGLVQSADALGSNAEWDLNSPQTLWYESFNTAGTPTYIVDICGYKF